MLVHSTLQSRTADSDKIHYCTKCGIVYGIIRSGGLIFNHVSGKCDCAHCCCEHTRNGDHEPHWGYRDPCESDLKTLPYIGHEPIDCNTLPDNPPETREDLLKIFLGHYGTYKQYNEYPKRLKLAKCIYGKQKFGVCWMRKGDLVLAFERSKTSVSVFCWRPSDPSHTLAGKPRTTYGGRQFSKSPVGMVSANHVDIKFV